MAIVFFLVIVVFCIGILCINAQVREWIPDDGPGHNTKSSPGSESGPEPETDGRGGARRMFDRLRGCRHPGIRTLIERIKLAGYMADKRSCNRPGLVDDPDLALMVTELHREIDLRWELPHHGLWIAEPPAHASEDFKAKYGRVVRTPTYAIGFYWEGDYG